MKYAQTKALQCRGLIRLALAVHALLAATIAPSSLAWAGDENTISSASMDAVMRLLNSPNHPVPAMPIIVPQLVTAEQVDGLLAPGNLPAVFQITQATGPNADLAKVIFFQDMAVEYANTVNFRKIAAGSPAALHLYRPKNRDIAKPVYIFGNPGKQGADRFTVVDEAELRPDQIVDQIVMEGIIQKELGVLPALFTSFPLTSENEHRHIYEYKADHPNAAPTAAWITILFFSNDPKQAASVNRLRVMAGLERFFYYGKLRFAEADLSAEGKVYRPLIQNGLSGPLPAEPELWVINPDTHQAAKYSAGPGNPPLADLGHAALVSWPAKNAIPPPPDQGLDTDVVWRELLRLAKLQNPQ
jgi:hypothetical protein